MTDSHGVIEELQKKNRDLIGKLAILQKQFDDALVVTHTFDGISAKNAELEKEIHNYISKNDDLVRRIQILSQTNSELTKKFEDERANGQSHLRCEISDLQDQLRRCQVDHEKVVASLNMKIEQTQKEHSFVVENYQKEIRRIYDAASQFLGTPIRETDTLITLLLSKTNPNATSAQGTNSQNSLPCPQCIHAKVDVRSKDDQSLKVIRSEIKSLKNKTNKLNSIAYDQAQSIENLVKEKAELLDANKCLHDQLEDVQRAYDEQIKEIVSRHKKLKSKLATSIENEKSLEKEKIIINEQINCLKKEISNKEDENRRLLNEAQQLKDQNALLDKDISKLKEKCQELNDTLQKNNEAAEESRLEAKNSQNALQTLHRMMNDQKEEIMSLQSQRQKLISHLQMLNSTLCLYEKLYDDQSKNQKNKSKIELRHPQFPSELNDLLSQISTKDESRDEDIIQDAFSIIFNYYDNVTKSQNESINRYKNDLESEKMRLNQIVDNFNRRIQNSFNDIPKANNNQATNPGFNQQTPDFNNGMNQSGMQFPGNFNDNNNNYEYNNGVHHNYSQSSNYTRNDNSDFVSNNHGNQSFSNQLNHQNLPYDQLPVVNPDSIGNPQFQKYHNNSGYPNSCVNNNSNLPHSNLNPNNYNGQQQMPNNNNNNNSSVPNPNTQLNNPYSNSGFHNGSNNANSPYPNNNNSSGFNTNNHQQNPNGSNDNSNQNMHSNQYPNSNNSNMNSNNYNEHQQLPNSNNNIPSQSIRPSDQYSTNNNSGLNATNNNANTPYPNNNYNNNAFRFNPNDQQSQQFPNQNNSNLPYTNRNVSSSEHPGHIIYNRLEATDKSSQSQEKLLETISQKDNELHEIFAILHVNCFLDAKSSLEQLQLTIQVLQKKLRDKKDKMKELITEYQQYQTDSEEKIQIAQKTINKIQKKLLESEEMRNNEKSEYEMHIKEMAILNEATKDQMKQMKIQINQKAEKNTESRNRLEEEIRNKSDENYQLLQQIEELRNDISKKEVVIQQLRSFTKYFAKKQSQKHTTEQEVMKSQLSQIINQLKTKNIELKKSLGEVKEKMNSSELQYSKAKKQISDYYSKIQELEIQLESFQNEAERGRSLAESKHKAALIAQETEFQSHIEDSKYQIENAKREIMAYVGLQFCSFFNAKEQIDSNNFESFIQRLRQKFESLINLENNLRRLLSLNSADSIESAVSHMISQKKT